MRFSLLLPTRNGGSYLQHTIDSILRQELQDWELVISDNASDPETQEIISGASGDARVRAARFEEPVSVTENWMATLRRSSGEYLLLLGDDDCLLPGTLSRFDAILLHNGHPDCVLYNGYSYVCPGSIHGNPVSYYSFEHFRFGSDFAGEMHLNREVRQSIVADMFRFRARIPLNMQTTLVKRSAVEKVRGDFFQPPFPDHYALNSLLLMADDWVYTPGRLVVVGVSPKSFGHYFYSNDANHGRSYLGIEAVADRWALPGNDILNSMYRWLLLLKETYPDQLAGIPIDRGQYVRRQVYSWFAQCKQGEITGLKLIERLMRLNLKDWVRLLGFIFDAESWKRLGIFLTHTGFVVKWPSLRPLSEVTNISEFVEWTKRGQPSPE
jgi:glycosyltransferase involved in cell wall biosynthesis